jgi:hypothetical protein
MKQKHGDDDQRVPGPPRGGARVGPLVRHNLVAIGTAAVLTVYSAGYARTREAAKRFAEADQAARRPMAPVINIGDTSIPIAPSRRCARSDIAGTCDPTRRGSPGYGFGSRLASALSARANLRRDR